MTFYNLNKIIFLNSIFFRLSKATRENKIRSDVPGPGNYDIKSKIGEGPAFKIRESNNSASAHESKIIPSTAHHPDPGSYDPNFSVKFTNFAYSIGQKTKDINYNNVPGPGAYEKIIKSSSSPFYS